MLHFSGYFSKAYCELEDSVLTQMLDSIVSRQGMESGVLCDREFGMGVCWADQVEASSGWSPCWNEQRDIMLIFSGEHFGGPDGGNRSQGCGPMAARNGTSDAQELVRLYEKEGPALFRKLNGVFCGLLVDRRQERAYLFNDRYGLGRVYYHEGPQGVVFSTRARALLQVVPRSRQLDPVSLGESFACGCALQDRTLFAGVSLLPGGAMWSFAPDGSVQKTIYFRPEEWEQLTAATESEYYMSLKRIFPQILPHYFHGDRRVGLSLTGGLDSRMILACGAALPVEMPCYTFGGMYRECADVRLGRELAQICGLSHSVIPVAESFFTEFPELARRTVDVTDGAMDVTGAVEIFVNRAARRLAPVRMTGNYGSEILRRNVAFKPVRLNMAMFESSFQGHVRIAAGTYQAERQTHPLTFIAFKQVPWHHYARLAAEQSEIAVRSPYLDNELVQAAYQAPPDLTTNQALAHRFIAEQNPALAQIPTDRGVTGGCQARANWLMRLRREFLPRVEYMMDYGMPQWLARLDRVLAPLRWERMFLGHQKFYHFRSWYRGPLARYIREVLLDEETLSRPYLSRRGVRHVVDAHTGGRANYTLEIHKLLTTELTERQLIRPKQLTADHG